MLIQNIPCKLIQRKGKTVEVEINAQVVSIPSEYLPSSVLDGQEMQLCFLNSKDAKIKEENLAKIILDEILNGK